MNNVQGLLCVGSSWMAQIIVCPFMYAQCNESIVHCYHLTGIAESKHLVLCLRITQLQK